MKFRTTPQKHTVRLKVWSRVHAHGGLPGSIHLSELVGTNYAVSWRPAKSNRARPHLNPMYPLEKVGGRPKLQTLPRKAVPMTCLHSGPVFSYMARPSQPTSCFRRLAWEPGTNSHGLLHKHPDKA